MKVNLESNVALMTGAARGIGQAIDDSFAANGACVVRIDRIINIASVMGLVGARLQCAFTAAKAGVINHERTRRTDAVARPPGAPGHGRRDCEHRYIFRRAREQRITGQTLCVDGGWTAGGFFQDF